MLQLLSVSIDYQKTVPIELNEILAMAYSPKTPDDYADYLHYVLQRARKMQQRFGHDIAALKFRVHKTGCILPFGEGSDHPYGAKHFFTEMWVDLPDDIQKAR